MEPPQRKHDARIQVEEAAWVHRVVSNAQSRPARPQDGGADGQQAENHQGPGGALHAQSQSEPPCPYRAIWLGAPTIASLYNGV